ncbi:MAG: HAD family hydrolase [bacterium]|nr:HAD family hydrolase [bacterium]
MLTRVLLFDFDGVIVDSFDCFHACFAEVCRELSRPALATREAFLRLFDTNLFEGMAAAGLTPAEVSATLATLSRRLTRAGRAYDFYAGMEETLRALAATNPLYIVTSNLGGIVEEFLAGRALAGVREVLGAEKEQSKTRKILEITARHPGLACYYVGDTQGDMIEGRRAGARTVGAAWGWHGARRLAGAHPDHLVHTPAELLALFGGGATPA